MRFLSSIRIVRVSLALAVASWMAGAGCLLGCGNMMAADASSDASSNAATPASSSTIVAAGEACASMHAHDCCAKHRTHSASRADTKSNSTTAVFVPGLAATPATMMDCPLAVNAAAALSKAASDQSSVALASTSARASLSNSSEQTSAFARPLRLPNRGHTYLRCCVFLI